MIDGQTKPDRVSPMELTKEYEGLDYNPLNKLDGWVGQIYAYACWGTREFAEDAEQGEIFKRDVYNVLCEMLACFDVKPRFIKQGKPDHRG